MSISTFLKKFSMATAGTALVTLGTVGTTQASTLSLESATFSDANANSGYLISQRQSLGWRFQLNDSIQVTDIGGNFADFINSGNIFGAIVALSASNALPSGNPLTLQGVLAATTFTPTSANTDTLTPLSVLLNPGNYALIFGSGQFGASGFSAMPFQDQTDLPGSSYFFSEISTWRDGGTSKARFIVKGQSVPASTSVPEPTSVLGLLTVVALGAASQLIAKRVL